MKRSSWIWGAGLLLNVNLAQAAMTQMTRDVFAYTSGSGEERVDQGAIVSTGAQSLDLRAVGGGPFGSALAESTGKVDFGQISFRLESAAASFQSSAFSSSKVGVGALWQDELVFESDSLAPGTPVFFRIFGSLHRTLSGTNVGGSQNVGGFIIGAGHTYYYDYPTNCGADATPCLFGEATSAISSDILQAVIGEVISIGAAAGGVALASAGPGATVEVGAMSQVIDATNTARFAIQLLTPGTAYRAASGTQYLSSLSDPPGGTVEAPAPWTLLIAGATLWLVFRRGIRRTCQ